MHNILVTGAEGFIGKNLVTRLKHLDVNIFEYDRDDSIDELKSFIKDSSVIFHLAGENRPKEIEEFTKNNVDLTQVIINIMKEYNKCIPIMYASSIQAELNNPYGVSKRAAENVIFTASSFGASPVVYRFHNVFGKWCRPNYNSVVATFCYNIAKGLDIQINDKNAELELIYIDDIVSDLIELIDSSRSYDKYNFVKPTYKITLGALADTLYSFSEIIKFNIIPDFSNQFIKKLFSTYLTYVDEISIAADLRVDNRGWLFEFIKSNHAGQIFISKTKPGITRGNHYHHTKIEKFCVVEGTADIVLRDLRDNSIQQFTVNGNTPQIVNIPPGKTHNIKNTGEQELICLFWSNEIFDQENPDTYFEEV